MAKEFAKVIANQTSQIIAGNPMTVNKKLFLLLLSIILTIVGLIAVCISGKNMCRPVEYWDANGTPHYAQSFDCAPGQ
ncbi:MAG: hypothetical protein EBR82_26085 [Caulobacteraceae bacterium]|nr:hypothetical protein [Caulobacteraceae bacterium]